MKGQTHITRGTAALHCGETPETWERGACLPCRQNASPAPWREARIHALIP